MKISRIAEALEQQKVGILSETPPKRRPESPTGIKSPKEEVLATREKISSKKIGLGVTDSSFVELKDDGKGVFKTELYTNERAAYLIDRFLGINLTPPHNHKDIGRRDWQYAGIYTRCNNVWRNRI